MSDVISKSIAILHALIPNENEQEWGATELSKKVDMPVQTVHRLLSSLAKHGFVYKNKETRKFRLGLTLMHLGFMVWENLSIRSIARPFMEQLTQRTKESCYLTVREGSEGIFIDSVDSPQFLRITEPVGMMRLPLNIGASKKVILAHLPAKTQLHLLKELYSNPHSPSIPTLEEIQEELKKISKNGYAFSYGETTEGTASVAAPIFTWDNQPIASISLAGPDFRFKQDRVEELIREVKNAAQEISLELGWMKKSQKG